MRTFFVYILLFTTVLSAQDSTVSQAFKHSRSSNIYPIIRPKYRSYPLMAGYLLVKSANEGDPLAQHELGVRYLMGQGFPADTVKAVSWIRKAVDKNLSAAKYNYGLMLNNGIGVEWNPFEAFDHVRYSANSGMPEAQFVFGIYYTDNLVTTRNYTEALRWFKKAAENDLEPAKDAVKEMEKMGVKLPEEVEREISRDNEIDPTLKGLTLMTQDWELDFLDFGQDSLKKEDEDKLVEEILTKNSAELQKTLGISKLEVGVDVPDTSGTEIIKFAASRGSPEALLIAGRAYEQGIIVEKDIILATAYYLKAFRLGSNRAAQYLLELSRTEGYFEMLEEEVNNDNPDAMFAWAGLTALGIDFQLSGEQAIELLEDASDEDHLFSLIELGLCYYNGNLVERDREMALDYWEDAIELGSEEARIRTAFAAIQSADETSDLNDEVKILMIASEQGSVLAQAALGYCYEKGIGVKAQKGIAAKLFRTAAHRGSQAAFNSLLRMYDEIRPENPEFEIFED